LQKNEWVIGQDPEMCTRSSYLYAKASQPSNNISCSDGRFWEHEWRWILWRR